MTVIVDPATVDLDAGIIIAKPGAAWVAEYDKPCEAWRCRGGEVQYPEWVCQVEPCTDCHGSGRAVFQIANGTVPLATVSITEVLPIVGNLGGRADVRCVEMVTPTYHREWYFTDDSPPSDPFDWYPPNESLHRQRPLPAAAEPGDVAVFVTVHERHDR